MIFTEFMDVTPFSHSVLLSGINVAIWYQRGNSDYLLGNHWADNENDRARREKFQRLDDNGGGLRRGAVVVRAGREYQIKRCE
jgi:hypothetical protein